VGSHSHTRAVQFSLSDTVCQRIVEVERVDIEFAGDVFDTVGAQDVDGEASEAGEVCRLDAGSAGVFAERDVADVMASVLDAPVASDRLAECLGAEGDLTGVEGDFLGFVPEAGLRVLVPDQAGDAGGLDDQAVPFGAEQALDVEGLDLAGLMAAVTPGIDALEAVGRRLVGGDAFERGQQGRLIGLDLGEQGIAAVTGRLKGFFDSAGRRR
jgi:hypothetical protein